MMPPKLNILVADDDEPFRAFLKQSLVMQSYDVVSCRDGQEAIDILSKQKFDVILLDHKMPECPGLNVLQWIHDQKLNIPVILLTGEGSEQDAVEAMKLGVYDYLQKGTKDIERIDGEIRAAHGQHMLNEEKSAVSPQQPSLRDQHLVEMINSVASVVMNSLATLQLRLDESEQEMKAISNNAQQDRVKNIWDELKSEREVLTSSVNTLLSLAKAIEVTKSGSFVATHMEEFKKKFPDKL
jgi:DNA-binding NtrC family response regulator